LQPDVRDYSAMQGIEGSFEAHVRKTTLTAGYYKS
jgi:hypothetical protein